MIQIKIPLQQKQEQALNESWDKPAYLYGGAKGGGKSYLVRAREYLRRMEYPGTRGLIIRKTYPELLSNHIRQFFKEYPSVKGWYNKAEKTIYFPNGSTTEFSYLRYTDDVYTYQGREYEDINIDEITQHEEEVFKILRSSNRTTNPNITPTMFLTGNPGGIGHQWVKRLFVDREFSVDESPEDYGYLQAFVQDNRALIENYPEYIKTLEALPDHLRRAYLDGDWNIFAGQAFTELSRDVHLIDPFELPASTRYFAGLDIGYSHPFAFVLCAITVEGKLYVVKRASENRIRIDQQARKIKNLLGDLKINIYTSPDAWSNRGGKTIIHQFRDELPNQTFIQAYNDRQHGVAELRKVFAYQGTKTNDPMLKFFKNCEDVYTNVASMQYDEKKPEDVLKVDANEFGVGGDDYYDALRYAVVSWMRPANKAAKTVNQGTGAWLLEKIKEAEKERNDYLVGF